MTVEDRWKEERWNSELQEHPEQALFEEAVKLGEHRRAKLVLWLLLFVVEAVFGSFAASLGHGLWWFLAQVAYYSAIVGVVTMLWRGFAGGGLRAGLGDLPRPGLAGLVSQEGSLEQIGESDVLHCPLCRYKVIRRKLQEHINSHSAIRENDIAGSPGCLLIIVGAFVWFVCALVLNAGHRADWGDMAFWSDIAWKVAFMSVLGFGLSVAVVRGLWRLGVLIADSREQRRLRRLRSKS